MFLTKYSYALHFVPNTPETQAEQVGHFRKANIPRDYAMSLHTNTPQNIIPLIYKALILN